MPSVGALCVANRVLADCLLECTGWGEIRSMSGGCSRKSGQSGVRILCEEGLTIIGAGIQFSALRHCRTEER
jgi:hypothetical protein